jgi:hypothetical protein
MAAMEPTVTMAPKEVRAKMPAKKRNCCRSHLNAIALPNPVHPVQLVRKVPMVHPEMQVVQAEMVKAVPKVHPVHPARLVPLAMLALMVQKEKMVT